jgi:eukaryotic-like serine/threonine-protein kinase
MALPGKIGKYEIQDRLGDGGVALVFQAYDPVIQRTVALKTIDKALLGPAERQFILERFRREAQAAGRLVHPNIVAIFEYGEDAAFAFIAMEFVIGEPLDRYLSRNPRPDLVWVRDFAVQLLDAMEYSHVHGVVHRDLKPSNILVAKDGRIKVSDFGIARIDASQGSQAGEALGTPNYMSPEQFQAQVVDHRSDIYSAGTILYEILTGHRPFTGATAELMQQVVQLTPRTPSEHNPELPLAMDEVLLRALAKRPADRWQSAHEFSNALEHALGERPSSLVDLEAGIGRSSRPPAGLVALARKLGSGKHGPGDAQGSSPERTAPKARVLFVDDEERILTALKVLFRSGFHVFTATDGSQALEFVRRFPLHVIVTDQRMPGMTGVELLRDVRNLSPNTVRILLTGYSDLAAIVGSINDGEVYRFISKPWNNEDMQAIVAEAAAIGVALSETYSLPGPVGKTESSVLVVDDDQDLYRAARELLASLCPVAYSRSPEEALKVMQEVEVAAIVADLDLAGQDMTSFVKLLKQEHPEILSIAVTSASDSEAIIDLINQAQIFRFLNKPVSLVLLKQHALAALSRYQQFKTAPQLVGGYRVEESAEARVSIAAGGLLDGLRALRSRIASTDPAR